MNANYMITMLLQAHTIDMGSHHKIFEEILTFILREIQEEPPSSDPPKDTVEEVSTQNNDIAKTVRNVHDIVSDYLRSKQISIEDLVTVTPFWPTMESLNPPVISPLAPIHPHRPCALDFFLHRDELQLIGMSMLTEYVSSIRDGAKMGFSQALTSTDSNDSAEYAPLVTAVEYIFDSTKSTLIPALVKFSYAVLPSNNTNAIPAIADAVLINLAERTSSDEESKSRSISKKSKERNKHTENKSSSSSAIRKSGRATKTPLSSYENRFINKKDPKPKAPLEAKKQPRRTSKKKNTESVHYVDDGYDDAIYSLAEHSSLGHSSAFNNIISESSHRRSYHPSSSVRENTSYKPIATSNQENVNFSSTILPSSSSSSSVMSKQVTSLIIPVTL